MNGSALARLSPTVVALALFGCLALPGCGFSFGPVTRVVDGIPEESRYISPEAYAAYARGTYFESRGELGAALDAYEQALDEDANSPEIYTRIGAVRCKTSFSHAQRAFERALDLDPEYAPAWHERARCLAANGRHAEALTAATRGLELDPERLDTSLLIVELQTRLGKTDEARRWLDALVTLAPSSRPAAQALLEAARRDRDRGRELWARELLRETPSGGYEASIVRAAPEGSEPLAVALARGDLAAARRAAVAASLTAGELAALAAAAGHTKLAHEQATLALSADPSDSDAWIAGLVALDLSRDEAAFAEWLDRLDAAPRPPRALAARLLSELLERRTSAEAARAFRRAYGVPDAAGAAEGAP